MPLFISANNDPQFCSYSYCMCVHWHRQLLALSENFAILTSVTIGSFISGCVLFCTVRYSASPCVPLRVHCKFTIHTCHITCFQFQVSDRTGKLLSGICLIQSTFSCDDSLERQYHVWPQGGLSEKI